ncbi:MAG: PTS system mannose/fructose/sorbose family transporter subunit IID [Candidatus Asgardarchaeia archaeon]
MQITLLQSILITLWAFIAVVDAVGPKNLMAGLPLIGSLGVGLIMGDVNTALIVGGYVSLISLGLIPIGGSVPPDFATVGIVSAAYAIAISGGVPATLEQISTIILIVTPVAYLGQQLDILTRTFNVVLVKRAESSIEKVDLKGISVAHLLGFITWGLSKAIPVFFFTYFGVALIDALISSIPTWLLQGLGVAGAIMPSVGLAILLSYLISKRDYPYLMAGFLLGVFLLCASVYLSLLSQFTMLIVAIFAVAVSFIVHRGMVGEKTVEIFEEVPSKLTSSDLRKIFVRYWTTFEASWNFERMQGLGFLYSILPALKKIYSSEDELKRAMRRHIEFFNTNPILGSLVLGTTIALEEKIGNMDEDYIRSFKTSMMGVIAGVGDSLIYFFVGGLLILICSQLAIEGNILGPILFLIFFNVICMGIRYYGLSISYKRGLRFIYELSSGGRFSRYKEIAKTLAVIVIGGLIPTVIKVNVKVIALEALYSTLLSSLIALTMTYTLYKFVKKGISYSLVFIVQLVIGLLLGSLGILGV